MDTTPIIGRVWLYHESGAKVELPVEATTPIDAYAHVGEYLAAGWLVNAPDNSGLDRLDVAFVVRGVVTNENRTTPRIYMYSAWGKQDMGSQLTVYLNTPEDIAAFESASGVKLDSLPIVKGKAAPTKESGDFERNAKPVQFTVFRQKEEYKDSPSGYRWSLVKYANGATPARADNAPASANVTTSTNNTQSQEGGESGQIRAYMCNGAETALDDEGRPTLRLKDGSGKVIAVIDTTKPLQGLIAESVLKTLGGMGYHPLKTTLNVYVNDEGDFVRVEKA